MAEVTGAVTISPIALISIISRTVGDVAGVSRLGTVPPLRVGQRLTGSQARDGVQVRVDGVVMVDIYLIAQTDINLLQLGEQVQAKVTEAIREMVNMDVGEVNVYIQDIGDTPAE